MTDERFKELELNMNATLTVEELKEGWHFCDEFDFLCTQGELLKEDGITCICGFDRRRVCGETGCNGFLCPWHGL